MDVLLFPGYFLVVPIITFVVPGIIFWFFLNKEDIKISIGKSIWEVCIAKITCIIIAIFIATILQALIILIIQNFIDIKSIKQTLEIIFFILSISIYYFFYYKFLYTTTNIISYDEETNKKVVTKFMLSSEIITSVIISTYIYVLGMVVFTWLQIY